MTTIKRLWLGFAVLSALLVVSVGSIIVLVVIVRQQVHQMVTVTRPRSMATREMEINVLDFAVGVDHYLQSSDSAPRQAAIKDASDLDRYLAEYRRLAATASHRQMAARFTDRWDEFRTTGHALMQSERRRPNAAELARFAAMRLELEQLLDSVIQPDALAALDNDREIVERTIRRVVAAGLALLILGLAIALWTSWRVARGIARAEATVINERNRLESTFQAMQDGVALFDLDGNLVVVNQALARINGFASPKEMKRHLSYYAATYELSDANGTSVPVEQWPVSRVMRGETIENVELRGRRRDIGREWFLSFSGMPVRDEAGRHVLSLVITHDLTTRKRAEDQLRQAQKMEAVGQLTGGIAHDFNNILTVIIGNAEVMASALPADAKLQEDMSELLAAAQRGATMIQRLLQFSRRGLLSMQPVLPGDVVGSLSDLLRRLLPETIQIKLADITGPSDTILADTGAVEQMLMNLCTNARDAMPEGGALRIECERTWLDEGYHATHPWVKPGAYVSIAVTDTGTGMDEHTKRKVFEPFFTTKPASKGTGLGMAMVYGLMKEHNGMVHVYSELGQGTTVKLYFPVAARDPTPFVATRAVIDPKQVRGGTETILLAEDEAAIRRTTVRALGRKGYTVLVADDGEEALELYRQNKDRIALVISDLVMPKLGGRQLAEALRQEGSEVPILFTSGYSPESASRGVEFPTGVAFLQKPWTLTDLFVQVRTLLDE